MQKKRRVVDKELIKWIKNNVPCVGHGSHASDDCDHIQTKGSGGSDVVSNLLPICRGIHTERHAKGLNFIANKYPSIKYWLLEAGWEYDETRKKWRR